MTRKAARRPSLTWRLILGLILPTATLALILGIGGALMIHSIVEGVNDRLLNAAGRAIADTVTYEDGEVTLDLPSAALGMLENNERDNVYYSVRRGSVLVTGYPDMPVVATPPAKEGETRFEYARYRGATIRIAAIWLNVPRVAEPVVVQIAETLEERMQLQNSMLMALILLELVLVAVLTLLLPLSVQWGLLPLSKVRQDIDQRSPTDFTPISLDGVPEEMRSFLTTFNGLLFKLQDAVQGMRRFTADASHQMRTPLSILKAHLAVIRKEGLESKAGRASLADVEAATNRLQRLLTQLLALARAEGARDEIGTFAEPLDMVALVRDLAESFVPVALKAHVELQFDVAMERLDIRTVEAFAREILSNLIDNAIRYNRKKGTVLISIAATVSSACVSVEDDGPGIPADLQADVFTRFRRLNRDQKVEGSGLGLAIVETLAEAIHAQVSLSGRERGHGLRVEVQFRDISNDDQMRQSITAD